MTKKKKKKETKKTVNLTNYENYKEFPDGNVQFKNPHTGRMIQGPKGITKCPITGKKF